MTGQVAIGGVIPAGQELVFVNNATDAPSIFCDGFKGMSVQSHVTKVSFFEQIMDPMQQGVLHGRFVVNLVIPNDQFLAMSKLFKEIADGLPAEVTASMQIPAPPQP